MSNTDREPFNDSLKWRLRAELNRIRPLHSTPRYAATRRVSAWRLAPVGLFVGVIGMITLSAFAATGSPNPVVWSQRIVTVIEPAVAPQATPPAVESPAPSSRAAPAPAPAPAHPTPRAEQSERPEGSPRPQPSASPQPYGGGGGDDRPNPTPPPTPGTGDH